MPDERPTFEQVLSAVESFKSHAARSLMKDKRLYPVSMVFTSHRPGRVEPSYDVHMIPCPSPPNERARDLHAAMILETARQTDAIAVVLIMDTWFVEKRPPPGVSLANFRPVPASQDPDRQSAIYVQFEHVDLVGPTLWIAPYLVDAKGEPTKVAPFKVWSDGSDLTPTGHGGRFASLLPRKGADA